MLDIKKIRDDPASITAKLHSRDPTIDLGDLLEKDARRREILGEEESLRRDQREESQALSQYSGTERKTKLAKLKAMSTRLGELRDQRREADEAFNGALLALPNIIQDAVPISKNKEDSVVVKTAFPKPSFDFSPVDHVTMLKQLGLVDFERGAKVAGADFPMYRGHGAILEFALWQYMINHHNAAGFEFVLPPILNNTAALTNGGNLPKFAAEIYSLRDDELHLIPTAEVPLTSMFAGEVVDLSSGPLHLFSYTPNFRREAGGHGRKDKGLMRMHQFNKVETYAVCEPDQSAKQLEFLVDNATALLDGLGLHYRVANLPSCDLAHQSSQTFDIEIWIPTQNRYSEVSSGSNCTDFQARRANIKFRNTEGRKEYVHTINCSGLATPRVMVAMLESGQTRNGGFVVPEALQKYTGFDYIPPKR